MNRLIAAFATVALVSGCIPEPQQQVQPGTPVQLTSAQKQHVQSGVRSSLKDPDSARFGGMAASKNADGVVTVCGMVNARNSFGGYIGMTPYVGVLLSSGGFTVASIGSAGASSAAIISVCRQQGIPL